MDSLGILGLVTGPFENPAVGHSAVHPMSGAGDSVEGCFFDVLLTSRLSYREAITMEGPGPFTPKAAIWHWVKTMQSSSTASRPRTYALNLRPPISVIPGRY